MIESKLRKHMIELKEYWFKSHLEKNKIQGEVFIQAFHCLLEDLNDDDIIVLDFHSALIEVTELMEHYDSCSDSSNIDGNYLYDSDWEGRRED